MTTEAKPGLASNVWSTDIKALKLSNRMYRKWLKGDILLGLVLFLKIRSGQKAK